MTQPCIGSAVERNIATTPTTIIIMSPFLPRNDLPYDDVMVQSVENKYDNLVDFFLDGGPKRFPLVSGHE